MVDNRKNFSIYNSRVSQEPRRLSAMLSLIRGVRRAIADANTPEQVLKRACETAAAEPTVTGTWAILLEEQPRQYRLACHHLPSVTTITLDEETERFFRSRFLEGRGIWITAETTTPDHPLFSPSQAGMSGVVSPCTLDGEIIGYFAIWRRFRATATDNALVFTEEIAAEISARLREITLERDRALLEGALRQRESEYRDLFWMAPVGIIRTSLEGVVLDANRTFIRMLGYENLKEVQAGLADLQRDFYREPCRREQLLSTLKRDGTVFDFPVEARRKDGTPITLELTSRIYSVGEAPASVIVSYVSDITEREEERKARAARAAEVARDLHEKEILLREIHHRVKNNLSVIRSLFHLQYSRPDSLKQSNHAFRKTSDRIQTIAMIHEILYETPNVEKVPLHTLIERLVGGIRYSLAPTCTPQIRMDLEEVLIRLDTAVPVGLVVQELVENAFQHGVSPDGTTAFLSVSLRRGGSGGLTIIFADAGPGVGNGTPRTLTGIGLQIVDALVSQVDGTISFRTGSSSGTGLTVEVALPEAVIHPHATAQGGVVA
jgi:PAS domain S-box-containing protein